MDKLKENIKKSINFILLDAVILTIVSIIIYIYTKGQLEVYQILVVLYILKLMENIVNILLITIKKNKMILLGISLIIFSFIMFYQVLNVHNKKELFLKNILVSAIAPTIVVMIPIVGIYIIIKYWQ